MNLQPFFRSPLWQDLEGSIKSLKHYLRRVLDDAKLTYEEMSTLLALIEACLNSRSLQVLFDDLENLVTLTPDHFLIDFTLAILSLRCWISFLPK